ncbi:MAG: sodium:solute symporter [Bacteroidales bacterium]|nr:sodium:solute symporter [Bacteroidales bacterium]MDD4529646.1 sodium:solute symporter [Bacteroidales bacterium]MDD4830068.1 sodium:solute symporter [Bacteroidales bacterium]
MEQIIFWVFIIYTLILFGITYLTARKANNQSFFSGNKRSPWFVVAYGMIGASLSGVTFMSVPGWVNERSFTYMLTVFGFFLGYMVIAFVLMPTYYKLNLTSIYQYLETRFGRFSHKTGSFFFLLSRTLGASLRMFIVIIVLQKFVFGQWGVPFELTVVLFLLLILLFTFKGGIKTIIWTDTLQTTFMLTALVMCFVMVSQAMNMSVGEMFSSVWKSDYTTIFVTDSSSRLCWWKQILGGMFISISMTGLDQEMMQKNLSCKDIKSAQKNMTTFSITLFFVNFLFLMLGAALYIYANKMGIDAKGDNLFPTIAIEYLSPFAAIVFIIGLISALFPSADGALTSLTTAFSIDFLNLEKREDFSETKKTRVRHLIHTLFALLFVGVIIFYYHFQNQHLIDILYQVASITYGPLLGLFAFGLLTKRTVKDKFVPIVCLLAPIICFILSTNSKAWFNYGFDFELLPLNGFLTFMGLMLISRRKTIQKV